MDKSEMTVERQVDEILIELWNDIVNRQRGEILFEEATDILTAREMLLTLIKQSGKSSTPDVN